MKPFIFFAIGLCATLFAQSPEHDALRKEIAALQKKPTAYALPDYLPQDQDFNAVCRKAGEAKKRILVSIGREACGRCQRFYELLRCGEIKIDTNTVTYVRLDIDDYNQREYFLGTFEPPDSQLPFVGVTDAARSTIFPCLSGSHSPAEYQKMLNPEPAKTPAPRL